MQSANVEPDQFAKSSTGGVPLKESLAVTDKKDEEKCLSNDATEVMKRPPCSDDLDAEDDEEGPRPPPSKKLKGTST